MTVRLFRLLKIVWVKKIGYVYSLLSLAISRLIADFLKRIGTYFQEQIMKPFTKYYLDMNYETPQRIDDDSVVSYTHDLK